MPEEFKAIETQDAFDAAVKDMLERSTKTVTEEVTKKFEGYLSPDDYTSKIAGLNQKLEENKTTIANLTAKNKAYEVNSKKLRIADEAGIPLELADKLSGETDEEIKADAEKLAKYMHRGTPPFSSEKPSANDTQKTAYMEMLSNLRK